MFQKYDRFMKMIPEIFLTSDFGSEIILTYTKTVDEDEYFEKKPQESTPEGGKGAGGFRRNGLQQGRLNGKPSRKDGNLTRYRSDAYDGT